MNRFAAIDFETANEKWDSACAVGVAVAEGGRVVHSESHLIRPHELRFSSFNTGIHGITEADVAEAPPLADVWPRVMEAIAGFPVVAHNAKFDFGVIRHAFHANGMEFPELDYLCSVAIGRAVWPEAASHSLGMFAPWLGIELVHHQAESDARASAEIVLKACEKTGELCPLRLAERLQLRVGKITPDGDWIPCSSGLRAGRTKERLELELPAGFSVESHPLFRKNVVVTGALSYCSRENAQEIVETLGGSLKSTVSKKTHILVAGTQDLERMAKGQDASSKMRKAIALRFEGLPIEVITPDDFYERIFAVSDNNPPPPNAQAERVFSKEEIIAACPFKADQAFRLWTAYNEHLHSEQEHLLHTCLHYRSVDERKRVFVLVHALVDDRQVETFEYTPAEAMLEVFPSPFGRDEGKQLQACLNRVRGWMEEADVDSELFLPFCEWLSVVNAEHKGVIERQVAEYGEYWDS